MSPLTERLLNPISPDQPCGPDLGYDPRFEALETILRGKPEIDMGSVRKPAEPPDWGQLKTASIEFLESSKHLRAAVILCCTLIKTDGLPGLRDGLQLLQKLLENHWAGLYPLLDPDDGNDPQQRLNIIGGITASRNAYGLGWLQVIDYLYAVPICRPKGAAPITLDLIIAASETSAAPAEGEEGTAPRGPDAAAIAAQFASVSPEEMATTREIAQEAIAAVKGIDAFLESVLGSGGSINFEELTGVLQRIERTLGSNTHAVPAAEPAGDASPDAGSGTGAFQGGSGPGVQVTGAIRTRADVVRVLGSLCDYYRQCEPGSPVPMLLRRAQKLATMNFIDAMNELGLASLDQLRPSMGSVVDEPPAT